TTLLADLIPLLVARGLRISTIKHAHHEFDVDKPGKDSYRHREAGATEVLISSARRFALMHEHRGTAEPTLDDLVARLSAVDLVLVEGFKHERHAKIEVWRSEVGKPMLQPNDPNVIAVASDQPVPGLAVPVLDANVPVQIADFIIDWMARPAVGGARRGAAE
uniref:molybdopterin-guanine dinucleotide biosynthesis protein B n=1 Tax=Ferrovibrio sp. TaxID=1917215 RepID=UPI0026189493